jgi:hypothetical protein
MPATGISCRYAPFRRWTSNLPKVKTTFLNEEIRSGNPPKDMLAIEALHYSVLLLNLVIEICMTIPMRTGFLTCQQRK